MYHKTIVYGRVGKDPEVRYTTSGQAVANFSVAVTEKIKDREHTIWYYVQAWGKLAELCGEFVHKGDLILVDGRMNVREWEDRDGNKRTSWELVAGTIQFGPRSSGSRPTGDVPDRSAAAAGHDEPPFDDDDVPF